MRKPYDSDITREQFANISDDLENAKNKTRPRDVDLYDVFCAILYLLKNACTWRNIPHRNYYRIYHSSAGCIGVRVSRYASY